MNGFHFYLLLDSSSSPVPSSCSSPNGIRVSGLKPDIGSPIIPTLRNRIKKCLTGVVAVETKINPESCSFKNRQLPKRSTAIRSGGGRLHLLQDVCQRLRVLES